MAGAETLSVREVVGGVGTIETPPPPLTHRGEPLAKFFSPPPTTHIDNQRGGDPWRKFQPTQTALGRGVGRTR